MQKKSKQLTPTEILKRKVSERLREQIQNGSTDNSGGGRTASGQSREQRDNERRFAKFKRIIKWGVGIAMFLFIIGSIGTEGGIGYQSPKQSLYPWQQQQQQSKPTTKGKPGAGIVNPFREQDDKVRSDPMFLWKQTWDQMVQYAEKQWNNAAARYERIRLNSRRFNTTFELGVR